MILSHHPFHIRLHFQLCLFKEQSFTTKKEISATGTNIILVRRPFQAHPTHRKEKSNQQLDLFFFFFFFTKKLVQSVCAHCHALPVCNFVLRDKTDTKCPCSDLTTTKSLASKKKANSKCFKYEKRC